MTTSQPEFLLDAPAVYQIRVHGRLASHWADTLAGMSISARLSAGKALTTTLTGQLVDQAALIGVLTTLYELGFTLLSVRRIRDLPVKTAEEHEERALA